MIYLREELKLNIKRNISAIFTAAILALSFAACEKNDALIPESQTDTVNSRAADQGTISSQQESTIQNPKAQSQTQMQPTDTNTDTQTDTTSSEVIVTDINAAENDNTDDTDIIDTTDTDSEEMYSPSPIELGSYTVTAEKVDLDKAYNTVSGDSVTAEMSGGTLYILDGGKLVSYGISGTSAAFDQETKLAKGYTKISADNYGTVYISGDNANAVYISADGTLTDTQLRGNLELSDVQEFGLLYSKSSDSVLAYQNGETTSWAITNMKDSDTRTGEFNKIYNIEIAGDKVFVTGTSAEDKNNRKAAVYTAQGELISSATDKTSGNGMTSVTQTEYGCMVTSPGMISLYDYEYNMIGQTTSRQIQDLFGSDKDISVHSLFSLNDGTLLAVCTEDSENLCLYKLSVY